MERSKARTHVPRVTVEPAQRYQLINAVACFRVMQHRLNSGEAEDLADTWCEVEAEIDAVLKQHHAM